MKRRFFWLVALAGLVWLYLRRGARRPQPVDHAPPASDPADELRRKLDETKDRAADEPESHLATPEPPHADPSEPVEPSGPAEHPAPASPEQPSAPAVSDELDARRREIHEAARASADEMRGTSSDD